MVELPFDGGIEGVAGIFDGKDFLEDGDVVEVGGVDGDAEDGVAHRGSDGDGEEGVGVVEAKILVAKTGHPHDEGGIELVFEVRIVGGLELDVGGVEHLGLGMVATHQREQEHQKRKESIIHGQSIQLHGNARDEDNKQGQGCNIAGNEAEQDVETDAEGAVVGELVADIGIRHHPTQEDDGAKGTNGREVDAVDLVDKVEERETANLDVGKSAKGEGKDHAQGCGEEEEEQRTDITTGVGMLGEGGSERLKERDGTGKGGHSE